MLKKTISVFMAVIIMSAMALSCNAAELSILTVGDYELPIDITVNGEYIYEDAKGHFGSDGDVYVPFAEFCEALGIKTSYNSFAKTVTVVRGCNLYRFSAQKSAFGIGAPSRDIEMIVENGKRYVKAQVIANIVGADAVWDSLMCELDITLPGYELPKEYTEARYNAEDIHWLSRIVTCESGSVSVDAKIMVANVIMNRRESSQFPNTIKEVIFDKKFGIQFPPAHNGFIHMVKPTTNTILACKAALGGVMLVPDCKYFSYTSDNFSWVYQNCQLYKTLGNQAFYK